MVCNLTASSATAQMCLRYPLFVSWRQQRLPCEELWIQLVYHLKKPHLPAFGVFSSTAGLCEVLPGDFSLADMISGHPSASVGLPHELAVSTRDIPAWFAPTIGLLSWLQAGVGIIES